MVSNIRLSLTTDKDIKPYRLLSGINIYSIEEAIYLFYTQFKEYSTDFFETSFIEWVKTELDDLDIANKLEQIKNQTSFYQKSIEFLTINSFYSTKDIEKISLELFNWEKRGQIERNKIKADRFFYDNMFEKAIECYKNALDFDISNYVLYNNIAICYIRLKEYDFALSYLKKAINLAPNNLTVVLNIIEVLIEKNDVKKAIHFISRLNNMEYERNYYMGQIYFKNEEYDKARARFSRAFLYKREDKVLLNIADCFINLKKYDMAKQALEVLSDNDVDILIAKSCLYEKLNNIPLAIKAIEKANFYNRDNFRVWLYLARYHRQDYNLLRAEASITKAQSLAPNNLEILFEKALIKKAQGKFKEYQNILMKIVQNYGNKYREKIAIDI